MYHKAILILSLFTITISGCSVVDRFKKAEPTPSPTAEVNLPPAETGIPYPEPKAYPQPLEAPTQIMPIPYPEPNQSPAIENPATVPSSISPLEPLPDETNMQRDKVYIEKIEFVMPKSSPGEVLLHLSGSLPTPCHRLRAEVSKPDKDNRILVKVYSLIDPNQTCIQVIQPFDSQFSLGSMKSGNYTLWINGEQVNKFSL
jgi:hypothetical protein